MHPRSLRHVLVLLGAAALTGCPPPPLDDDDDDDDATTPGDDDDVTSDDDDDATSDDDDATGDDDDATTPAPPTTLTLLSPAANDTLEVFATFQAQIDGETATLGTFTIDGEIAHQGFFGLDDGLLSVELDTAAWPDGTYMVEVEAAAFGLSDSTTVTFANGDLVRYDWADLPYVYQAVQPVPVNLQVVDSAVSVTHMVFPQDNDPYEALFGYALNPDGDWAIGGPDTTLYPIGASAAPPWAGVIPNHPNLPWLTGGYNLYPWADETADGNDFDVTALVKRSFGPIEAGLLHIDFYFVSGVAVSAATASGSGAFQNFLDALEGVFLQADIALGDIGYFDVNVASFATIGDYEELVELFEQGVPSDDRVLNVFVVNQLNMPSSSPLGVASHVPGPALFNGMGQSGVAIVDQHIQGNEPGTAAALAGHEIGHYLGLFHGTEVGGAEEDPLNDTPTSCNGGGCWATNLMDPYLYGDTTLTADQSWVLLRHPLVELVPASQLPARMDVPLFDATAGIPASGYPDFCGTRSP